MLRPHPLGFYGNRSTYWQRNIEGLQKADKIITISEFSKNEIIKHAGIPADLIDVIYCGVDRNVFYPRRDRAPLSHLGIEQNAKVLLYVGSEEPRKNLKVLLEAVAILQREIPEIVLLKVGSPGMGGDRKATKRLIKSLQIENHVFSPAMCLKGCWQNITMLQIFLFSRLFTKGSASRSSRRWHVGARLWRPLPPQSLKFSVMRAF